MTTRDFIAKTYGTTSTRERHCSSVYTDHDGNVYSYGAHYPLLFKVAGHWFVNTRGYSNTTAKHINWAWSACDYNATAVELNREDARVISSSWASDTDKLNVLLRATAEMVARAIEERDSKKRKDTQVYAYLTDVLSRARLSRVAVKNLMEDN
jgi:hypothetical protein